MSAWKADALPLGDSRVELYSTVMRDDGQEGATIYFLTSETRAAISYSPNLNQDLTGLPCQI